MSNFYSMAYHPKEKVIRKCTLIDDYFGKHLYGVHFDGDPVQQVFHAEYCRIPVTTTVWIPKDAN